MVAWTAQRVTAPVGCAMSTTTRSDGKAELRLAIVRASVAATTANGLISSPILRRTISPMDKDMTDGALQPAFFESISQV
jgi:hypothetical protein